MSGHSRPIGSPTWLPCSRKAATRSGAGASTSGSAAATGPTRRRPRTERRWRHLAERPLAPGLVGYRDGRAVGWVSLGAARGLRAAEPFEGPRPGRRHARLVDRVLRGLAQDPRVRASPPRCLRPRSTMPASPRRDDARGVSGRCLGRRVPAADAFHGTLAMFERAGFTVVERRQWNPTTPVRPIVRLELAPGRAKRARASSLTARFRPCLRHPSRPWHRRPSGLTRLSPRR